MKLRVFFLIHCLRVIFLFPSQIFHLFPSITSTFQTIFQTLLQSTYLIPMMFKINFILSGLGYKIIIQILVISSGLNPANSSNDILHLGICWHYCLHVLKASLTLHCFAHGRDQGPNALPSLPIGDLHTPLFPDIFWISQMNLYLLSMFL